MKVKTPMRARIETLKIKGVPLFVQTNTERINAHNIAANIGIEIATRRRIGSKGFEIHRVK